MSVGDLGVDAAAPRDVVRAFCATAMPESLALQGEGKNVAALVGILKSCADRQKF